jgi:hypothetical protein
VGNYVYVIGGVTDDNRPLKSVGRFDISNFQQSYEILPSASDCPAMLVGHAGNIYTMQLENISYI